MATLIDHEEKGIGRLATQYTDSLNLIAYIRALLKEADALEEVLQAIITGRTLDSAIGKQLDIIGEIVGQPRLLIDSTTFEYFGFDGALGALSFGTVSNPIFGGRFKSVYETGTGNRVLLDEEYRVFIRARIIANYSTGTIDEIILALKNLIPGTGTITIVEDPIDREATISMGKLLTNNEIQFLSTTNLIPKPTGVSLTFTN